MKLYELRKLLRDYEQTWYVRKYFYGDHDEAVNVRNFLKEFESMEGGYELSASDIFKLLKNITLHSSLQLSLSIKNYFGSDYLLEIFSALDGVGLMNEKNFLIIYDFPIEKRLLLYSLFCDDSSEHISLTSDILDAVLVIASRPYISIKITEEFLRFLNDRNYFTPSVLAFVSGKADESDNVLKILQELDKVNCLNDKCLDYLADHVSLYSMTKLISLLNSAKIAINDKLIALLCKHSNIYSLIEIVSILIDAECQVTIEVLKQDFMFFLQKMPSLKLLQQHNMLDDEVLSYICNNNIYLFSQILEILSENILLFKNKDLVNKLVKEEVGSDSLCMAISYLNKSGLLDQGSLDACVKISSMKLGHSSFAKDIFSLFALLDENNFHINREMLTFLLSLSNANMGRLNRVTSNLIDNHLLDQPAFELAMQRITEKLPSVTPSSMVKNSRKETQLPRSEVILDNKAHFFMEHSKHYESGGFGKVKKGFRSPETDEVIYGVKKLIGSKIAGLEREAIREVKYHQLLGRQAFYFSNNGISIVAEWQREKGLCYFNPKELLRESFVMRLQCLSSGLSELNTLHLHYRIHGDIKSQNVILDLKNASMKLIDFGTSHKKDSCKLFACTKPYVDPHLWGDHFHKDLYAMGIVTMQLFPEIYTVSFDTEKSHISFNKENFTMHEQAVINLINAMMNPDLHKRCTSEDAFIYCNEVINKFDSLDATALAKIAASTINRSNVTVEDILRNTIHA